MATQRECNSNVDNIKENILKDLKTSMFSKAIASNMKKEKAKLSIQNAILNKFIDKLKEDNPSHECE